MSVFLSWNQEGNYSKLGKQRKRKSGSKSSFIKRADSLDVDSEEVKPHFDYEPFSSAIEHKKPKETPAKSPGKHRYFAQNFKHDIISEDSYGVCYQLDMAESDYIKIRRRFEATSIHKEFDDVVKTLVEDSFVASSEWDRFDADMRALSRKFKGTLFTVKGFGEDFPNDIFIAYALDGKYYHENIDIEYPSFERERLV